MHNIVQYQTTTNHSKVGNYVYISWVPFYEYQFTIIQAWISNHIHYKVWDEITYPFPNIGQYQTTTNHSKVGNHVYISWGPLYDYELSLIQAWISNHIYYKVWDEITYPFPNFNSVTIEVGNGEEISSHTLLGVWLLIHAGIKVNQC